MIVSEIACPKCRFNRLDLSAYNSMMVLSQDSALFTLECPQCGTRLSFMHRIPPCLRGEVEYAAAKLGAGMGRKSNEV